MASGSVDAADLAARTKHFRNSLIEEFRLSESDASSAFEAPKYSSDAFRSPMTVDDILRHKPHTLIKFKIFKRTPELARGKSFIDADRQARKPARLQRAPTTLTLQQWATWLSEHRHFSSFIIVSILVNAAIPGIQTFMDKVEDWREIEILEILDHCTMVIFVIEILLKWIANFRDFWKDGWNNFDFLVTAGSLIPLLAQLPSSLDANVTEDNNFADVAGTLRIFRTFRTLKMIAKFRSLRIIVLTIVEALQSLGFVLVLLILLMYIFAVLAISIFSDYSTSTIEGLRYKDKFVDMISSARTLFQLLTLDQWYNIAREISTVPTINRLVTIGFFVIWVALGAFIFRNIFIGVMVKNFQSISQELTQLDHAHKKKVRMERYVRDLHDHMEEKKRASVVGEMPGLAAESGDKDSKGPTNGDAPPLQPGAAEPERDAPSGPSGSSPTPSTAQLEEEERRLRTDMFLDADKANEWQKFVSQSLEIFKEQDPGTTMWPRDTLLEYLQNMERLQENMKEYQELQHLAALALYSIVTDT